MLCIFCTTANSVIGQNDSINIQGIISSSVTTNVLNIPVSVTYFDSLTTLKSDTVYTDTFGVYTSTFVDSTVEKVVISLPNCTSSTATISKVQIVPPYFGYVSYVVNFSNYCFSSEFSYFTYNDTVYFNENVIGGFGPYTYNWDFGDGSPINNSPNPQHHYTIGGPIYNIALVVIDTNSDTTSSSMLVNINDCIADFNHQQIDSNEIAFTNLSSTINIPSFYWSFGDTTFDFSTSPSHVYPAIGTYDACLEVTDSLAFCKSSHCELINVDSIFCSALFTIAQQDNIVGFIDQSSSNSIVPNLLYDWDLSTEKSQLKDPVAVYDTNGTYPIRLIITDAFTNCTDTFQNSVQVTNLSFGSLILSGQVLVDNFIDNTHASLIGGPTPQSLVLIDSMTTFKGHYSFEVSPNSTYYVRGKVSTGHPKSKNITPRYYETGFLWEDARSILVSNSSVKRNDINLKWQSHAPGDSKITGRVVKYSGSQTIPNSPIEGVLMVLTNSSDEPLSTDYTKGDGTYEFNGIGVDSYKVHASLQGKLSYPSTVKITTNPILIDSIDFTVYDHYIQFIDEYKNLIIGNIYPIPASDKINVEVQNNQFEYVHWFIIGLDGKKLLSGEIELYGQSTLEINIEGISSGFYVLGLVSGNAEKHMPLVIKK